MALSAILKHEDGVRASTEGTRAAQAESKARAAKEEPTDDRAEQKAQAENGSQGSNGQQAESDAKEALNKHLNGEREYTYFVSAEKVKRTIKGNRVDVKKVLAFHVMSAKSDLPGSRIWVKIN